MIEKVDYITKVSKNLQNKIKDHSEKRDDIIKRNKVVKINKKKPEIKLSAQEEMK